MTAGAAGRIACSNAHQQAGDDQGRVTGVDFDRWQLACQCPKRWRPNQPGKKGNSPQNVASGGGKQTAEYAADAGNAAVQKQEAGGGQPNQNTAS
jgi:hypothetical protein